MPSTRVPRMTRATAMPLETSFTPGPPSGPLDQVGVLAFGVLGLPDEEPGDRHHHRIPGDPEQQPRHIDPQEPHRTDPLGPREQHPQPPDPHPHHAHPPPPNP